MVSAQVLSAEPSMFPLVSGRAMITELARTDGMGNLTGSLAILNIHSARPLLDDLKKICAKIDGYVNQSIKLGPQFASFVNGDLDFLAPGSCAVTLEHFPIASASKLSHGARFCKRVFRA